MGYKTAQNSEEHKISNKKGHFLKKTNNTCLEMLSLSTIILINYINYT